MKRTFYNLQGDKIPLEANVSLETAVKNFRETLEKMEMYEAIEWVITKKQEEVGN